MTKRDTGKEAWQGSLGSGGERGTDKKCLGGHLPSSPLWDLAVGPRREAVSSSNT
jgi:hypothetical protein